MPNIDDLYPSKYLKAHDLGTRSPVVEIQRVDVARVGTDQKPIVTFVGHAKTLPLNKTNAKAIAVLVGSPNTEAWVGHRIRLITAPVEYQGQTILGIRIAAAPDEAGAATPAAARPHSTRAPEASPAPASHPADELGADDIRF